MSTSKLAFLGPSGTHTEQAAIAYAPNSELIPCSSSASISHSVESGETQEGIIAIENSLEGSVSETLDLLIHETDLLIKYEIVLPIRHFLVASQGTSLGSMEIVYSHPQALAQCRSFLSKELPDKKLVASMSTAAAVLDMFSYGKSAAAIVSARAIELYDVEILARRIEDNPNNETRFVVLSTSDSLQTGNDKTSICFSFKEDTPGILHSVLEEFKDRNINLAKIESRPSKQALGQYIFLIDLDGHRLDHIVNPALSAIQNKVSMLKVMGSYPKYKRA